jgi:hypothetical protein
MINHEWPKRFEMILCREGLRELVVDKILSDEERVNACEAASHETVAFAFAEKFKRFQTCTTEVGRPKRCVIRSVSARYCRRRPPCRIIFNHNYARSCGLYLLPNPIVIAIDVDAKKIELVRRHGGLYQMVCVFPSHGSVLYRQASIGGPIFKEAAGLLDKNGGALYPRTMPTVQKQIYGVTLKSILYSDFDETLGMRSDPAKDLI